jgi:hypothetical protein
MSAAKITGAVLAAIGVKYLFPAAIEAHVDDIAAAELKYSKTGVTFSPGKPIPDGLVEKLALASRAAQNL